ncbi:aminoacyl-tRNA hydrolase [Pelotomaculum sp. PtaB.Bin117]|uniref:aminoacyl-tRNA hydrolase n=1 Tax=Pelotomaculum sp. PtaB.Bin117 TaxID=1811694 RepID=UPI0009D3C265|nr:aminoacyl-tRNA hydrolase [Pelotomaculum sp. PtaB.Bin117]OPX89612.1 MAG: Peptidyl-tRNA hydrolase [Pelotomaculum sp. PtaB.Bin117]OPY61051.1 MAG: Peptidyl-tRNA hydrolase [Pelotomaculum sp. PtaU1.Bin065]
MKLIVGLGNPGREYAETRHNVGFMVVDRLASVLGMTVGKKLFKALVGQGQINEEKVVLAKPQTYMNLSGDAVGALLNWFKLTAADLLVIYDDLDLACGKLRLRAGGGSGGHKGMQSIIAAIGTDSFPRVRVGIGRPAEPGYETVDYVLGRFSGEEAEVLEETLGLASDAAICAVREGMERAMNLFNRR